MISRKISQLSFLFVALLLSSCAHLVNLDIAQRQFNDGAIVENNARFSQQSSSVSPDSYYRLAYAHVKDALKRESALDNDGVLGNAFALKALCEWKLGDYTNAKKSAKNANLHLVDFNNPNAPLNRDAAVMQSMDALINIEETNTLVFQKMNVEEAIPYQKATEIYASLIRNPVKESPGKIQSALSAIDEVQTKVPRKHEVRNYLIMSQLAGVKAWSDALHFLNDNRKKLEGEQKEKLKQFRSDELIAYEKARKKYLGRLAQLLPGDVDHPVHKYWAHLLGASN